MTDRDVVERVGQLLERAVVPLGVRRSHHKQLFAITTKGTAAALLMASIASQMGRRRRGQIESALRGWGDQRQRWSYSEAFCAVDECELRASCRGLCRRHYNHWYKATRHGRPTAVVPRPRPPTGLTRAIAAEVCDEMCAVMWLAGLLEGEGWFGVYHTKGHIYPSISVEMCDEDVIGHAARILGTRSIRRRSHANATWRATYITRINGGSAADWMGRLRPLMGARRSRAIDRALASYAPIRLTAPPQACIVPGCHQPHRARGLCHKHYMSWLRDLAKGRTPRISALR